MQQKDDTWANKEGLNMASEAAAECVSYGVRFEQ